jgi:hypothetical protein
MLTENLRLPVIVIAVFLLVVGCSKERKNPLKPHLPLQPRSSLPLKPLLHRHPMLVLHRRSTNHTLQPPLRLRPSRSQRLRVSAFGSLPTRIKQPEQLRRKLAIKTVPSVRKNNPQRVSA